MKNYLVFLLGLFLLVGYTGCIAPRVAAGVGSTTHFANTSTGVNFGIQYTGGFTEHLEGSVGIDYQKGFGNGLNYVNLRPALTYQYVNHNNDSFDEAEVNNGPLFGAYSYFGLGNNANYFSFGPTLGYRLRINESLYTEFTTDQGYGSQGFNGAGRNPVFHSNYRFSVGFRF